MRYSFMTLAKDVNVDTDEVHVVASLLKLYLRELPEPLLTYDLFEPFITSGRSLKSFVLLLSFN
jgi:hypothetical protein